MAQSSSETRSDRKIALHPLAIVSISDHSTGIQCGASVKPPNSKVFGILWGKQQGLEVVITDAMELQYETDESGLLIVSSEQVTKQKELYTEVYKNRDMLGWYSVGTEIQAMDTAIHKEMTKHNESPFFLLMHPNPDPDAKELPISLFESEMHMVNDEMKMIFVPCEFQLDTTQAERITMEEVAKANPAGGESTLDVHMSALVGSLRSLAHRNKTLVAFLEAARDGNVPMDHKLMRQISDICNQLPAVDSEELQEAFMEDYNDTLLVNHLATMTKATAQIADLSSKFSQLSGSGSRHDH